MNHSSTSIKGKHVFATLFGDLFTTPQPSPAQPLLPYCGVDLYHVVWCTPYITYCCCSPVTSARALRHNTNTTAWFAPHIRWLHIHCAQYRPTSTTIVRAAPDWATPVIYHIQRHGMCTTQVPHFSNIITYTVVAGTR